MLMDQNNPKARITVIDDERELVATIKEFLESRDYEISFAYGGESGLDVIKKEKPDIIILDITMPDMDGRDVLISLKKEIDPELQNIPVIMLTGKGEQFDRDYGIELGAYEYLSKPYDSHRLLRQVSRIMDKKRRGEI